MYKISLFFWSVGELGNLLSRFTDLLFLQQIFFLEIFFRFFSILAGGQCWRAKRAAGGVGERSEPPAGGLAVGAEGSVHSEVLLKNGLIQKMYSLILRFKIIINFSNTCSFKIFMVLIFHFR